MSNQFSRSSKSRSSRQKLTIKSHQSHQNIGQFSKRRDCAKQGNGSEFEPPENWHEPTGCDEVEYQVVTQPAGKGYRHIVTEREIRQRLDLLPPEMLRPLDVIQLSEMRQKKCRFPCYGMQWGTALYLYPVESSLVEYFSRPPKPNFFNEARMYGGRWVEEHGGTWKLAWTERSLKDYYLNNVLIHELGHLLDQRNSNYVDRERFAEWFAIQFGYRSVQKAKSGSPSRKRTVRRHHSK